MQKSPELNRPPEPSSSRSPLRTVLLVVAIAAITSVLTVWLTTRYLFPKEFTPATLDAREKKALDAKIDRLDPIRPARPSSANRLPAGRKVIDDRPTPSNRNLTPKKVLAGRSPSRSVS